MRPCDRSARQPIPARISTPKSQLGVKCIHEASCDSRAGGVFNGASGVCAAFRGPVRIFRPQRIGVSWSKLRSTWIFRRSRWLFSRQSRCCAAHLPGCCCRRIQAPPTISTFVSTAVPRFMAIQKALSVALQGGCSLWRFRLDSSLLPWLSRRHWR